MSRAAYFAAGALPAPRLQLCQTARAVAALALALRASTRGARRPGKATVVRYAAAALAGRYTFRLPLTGVSIPSIAPRS